MQLALPAFTEVTSDVASVGPVVEGAVEVVGTGMVSGGGVDTTVEVTGETTGVTALDSADGSASPTATRRTEAANASASKVEPSINRTWLPRPDCSTSVAPGTAAATVSAASRLSEEYSTVMPVRTSSSGRSMSL